jgi:hypothetical protein
VTYVREKLDDLKGRLVHTAAEIENCVDIERVTIRTLGGFDIANFCFLNDGVLLRPAWRGDRESDDQIAWYDDICCPGLFLWRFDVAVMLLMRTAW